MIAYNSYKQTAQVDPALEQQIKDFLFEHLEQYGDAQVDIPKCLDYALRRNGKPSGLLLTAPEAESMIGAVIINFTGMQDYIPGNILVCIATHKDYRGQGVGKQLIEMTVEQTEGNIALHVEPDNPAKKLYEKMGFKNKYLEMRLNK